VENQDRLPTDVWKLKKFRLPAAVLIVVVGALVTYLLRGRFRRFEIKPYPVPPAAFGTMCWRIRVAFPKLPFRPALSTGTPV